MNRAGAPPDVDYLTRDYEGFRQLLVSLVDRTATGWSERAAADLGVTLIEILAERLDHLAYAGDRVAEEAFLSTARVRENARRHAALGDHRLEQGNATSGDQRFYFAPGQEGTLCLPRGTRVMAQRATDEALVAETTEEATLDARRDAFCLSRSAPAGATWLRLRPAGGPPRDLRMIGLAPGARLCVRDRDTGEGEVITIRRVAPGAVELEGPLGATYLAASAEVLGNMVPIRRGQTCALKQPVTGGVVREVLAGDETLPDDFLKLRLAAVRRLRDEAEGVRHAWQHDPSYAAWWELAVAEVGSVVRALRAEDVKASKKKEKKEKKKAPEKDPREQLDDRLVRAARLFCALLRAAGRDVPEPSDCVAQPGQKIALRGLPVSFQREEPTQPPGPCSREERPGPLPVLWREGRPMLRVHVDGEPWSDVPDLLRSAPDDRHYVVEIDERGRRR